jgi:hypothetical protein
MPEGDIRMCFRSTEELGFFYRDLLEKRVAQGRGS